MIKANNLWL